MMPAAATSPVARSSLARWLAATCALLMCLGFIALGTWQLFRLQWKLDLIARVEQRVHAPAVVAPLPAAWPQVSKDRDEYRHVSVRGHYLDGQDALVQATTVLGSGFWLMTPFCTVDGAIVFVNRGYVAPARPKPVLGAPATCTPGAAAPVTVAGLLRLPEPGGGYLRNNDAVADRWFSRDVGALAASRKLGPVAPFFIDREKDADPVDVSNEAVGGLTIVNFPNSHLVYALTWFALAIGAAGGAWLLLRAPKSVAR